MKASVPDRFATVSVQSSGLQTASWRRITDDGRPIPVPGDEEPPRGRGCAVVVLDEPVPGDSVAVRAYNDLEPAAGIQGWFDDEYVGRTDGTGRVTGRVPYTRDGEIRNRLTAGSMRSVNSSDCRTTRRRSPRVRSADLRSTPQPSELSNSPDSRPAASIHVDSALAALDVPAVSPNAPDPGGRENASGDEDLV